MQLARLTGPVIGKVSCLVEAQGPAKRRPSAADIATAAPKTIIEASSPIQANPGKSNPATAVLPYPGSEL